MAESRTDLEAAVVRHRAGDLDGAAAVYRAVLARDPNNADAAHLSGVIALQKGDAVAAWDLIQHARELRPRSADIAYNLGRVAAALQDWPAAVEANRAALALSPQMSAAACNLGIALVHSGDAVAGEAAIRTALAADSNTAANWSALGLALHDQAKDTDARAAWEKARTLDPELAEAAFNLACSYLRCGDLVRGWPLFAARAAADPASFANGGAMPAHVPRWNGETLSGRRVLIWGEQGLGDQILYAGFIPMLGTRDVVLACAPRLVPLLTRAFPDVTVLPQDSQLATRLADLKCDVVIPLADLGHVAWPTAASPRAKYLRADPARVAMLRQRYQGWSKGGPLIGVSWHSHRATGGARKSLPLAQWQPIASTPGATLISVQYGDTEADLAAGATAGVAVHRDPEIDATHDMEGLAAQLAAVDLVISVSNTTVHLAGGLGLPVWTLAPLGGGSLWYWFDQPSGQTSPWYPHLRVFHQDRPGAWGPAVERVRVALENFHPPVRD